jgi:hypothetical protein
MSRSPASSPPRNGAGKSGGLKSSKLTDGCMANARSRRLINKFGGPEEATKEKRVRKAVTKRPRSKPQGGRTVPQRGSDFEFDSVYNEELTSRTVTDHEDTLSELTSDSSHFPPPDISPPHSPIPHLPSGSPPPSGHDGSYYRQGPLRYTAQTSEQRDGKPRVSHRLQPYRGYSAQLETGHMYPVPMPMPGGMPMMSGHFPGSGCYPHPNFPGYPSANMTLPGNSMPIQSFDGAPQQQILPAMYAQPQSGASGLQASATPFIVSPPAPVSPRDASPTSSMTSAQSLASSKMYLKGGGQGNILSLESKRAMRKQQIGGVGGDTFHYEIDLETLRRLQIHNQKSNSTAMNGTVSEEGGENGDGYNGMFDKKGGGAVGKPESVIESSAAATKLGNDDTDTVMHSVMSDESHRHTNSSV